MFDIEGARPLPGEEQRVKDALAALDKDAHAPREISVRLTLHIHNEYPKHVTIGENEDKSPKTVIVANEQEEDAVLAKLQADADAKQAAPAAPAPSDPTSVQ